MQPDDLEKMSPYFQHLAKQKRVCPDCAKAFLHLEPTRNELSVFEKCSECGYFQLLKDPRYGDPDFAAEMRRRGQRQAAIDRENMLNGLPHEEWYDIMRDELADEKPPHECRIIKPKFG